MTKNVKVFAKTIEEEATAQIEAMAKHPVSDGAKIRIMPDAHAGAGCTIGTTMTIKDRVCPNLVGVDIGCGVLAVKLAAKLRDLDLQDLDRAIRWNVPAGFNIHHQQKHYFELDGLRCPAADKKRAWMSLGTLGGGNHFIEVDVAKSGDVWLVIHSGSRHLGLEVANWYQDLAWKNTSTPTNDETAAIIKELKEAGRQQEIASALAELRAKKQDAGPKDLAYLTGSDMEDYLHDMAIVQAYADENRVKIAEAITLAMGLRIVEMFTTTHNYIDLDRMILRKGAVSAKKGERLIIPMNMRDGSLICVGKGNADWNYSAPHGAGRLMSRTKAKEVISMGQYRESMRGIHTTCINYDTLDEAPFAYKDKAEIMECIAPTCKIEDIIKPIYNFKASG